MAELWIPSSVDIDSRLVKRFTLSDKSQVQNPYWLHRTITPVTQIDNLLSTPKSDVNNEDLSGGAGTYVPYFTVPSGKRWTLKFTFKTATTAATQIICKIGGNEIFMTASGTAAVALFLQGIKMNEADSIGMDTTGDGGDANRFLYLIYEEEDSY